MTAWDDYVREANVSRETVGRLEHYNALLQKWNPRINLVSVSSLAEFWDRHVLDSAQLLNHAPKSAKLWADLGSGGGFPGLVIAILAAEMRPALSVVLVESDLRKAAFLDAVIRETGAQAKVISHRIEDIPPLAADVVSARALASLAVLLGYAERHLSPGGTAIFPKGAKHSDELKRALETWRFSYEKHPSRTDDEAVILTIGGLSSV